MTSMRSLSLTPDSRASGAGQTASPKGANAFLPWTEAVRHSAEGRRAALTGRAHRVSTWLLVASLVGLAFGLVWTAWLCDDAFITFRSMDHFVNGRGLVWNEGERVQAFTNPLWLFLLAPFYAASGNVAWTAFALGWTMTALATLFIVRSAASRTAAAFGVLLLGTSKAFLEYSTSGLENPLLHVTLLGAVATFLGTSDPKARAGRVAAWTAAAFLTRPDAVLFTGTLCAASWLAAPGVATFTRMVIGWSPALLWEAFSIVYYGTWLPNTAIAKLGGDLPQDEVWSQGLAYLENSARWDPVTMLTIACAAGLALARPSKRHQGGSERIVAGALILHLVYVVSVGGDFMSGRFLSGSFVVAVALLIRRSMDVRIGGVAALAVVATAAFHPRSTWAPRPDALAFETAGDIHGISDERSVYFAYTGLVSKGKPIWGRFLDGMPYPPAEQARERFEAGERVQRHTQIGLTGFLAPHDLHIIDIFGLADPLLARLPLTNSAGEPIFRHRIHENGRFWRVGHLRRGLPPGYVETVRTGEVRLGEPSLATFYEPIRAMTRLPLWSAERWRTLVAYHRGAYDDALAEWVRDQKPRHPK